MIKKGDLVMCVGALNEDALEHIGKIGTVARRFEDCWELEPPTICKCGREMTWHPSHLKKIDPPASGELSGVPLRLKEPA